MTSTTTPPEPGALHGLRVLELGSLIAGPFAGQLLGDYGAEVLKVEPVEQGDPMRRWGVTVHGEGLWWAAIARNKRSLALDLRTEEGQDLVRRLAEHCDVVLENFRPGTLARWNLDYPQLSARNPGLVLVHVSGFGQSGPRRGEAGFGSIGEAVGGIRFTTGDPQAAPARTGISLGDSLAALFAVIGALAALQARQRTGFGQEVDVAIYEAVAALMESSMADYERAGVLRRRSGSVLPGVAPSNVYCCRDGGQLLIAANADSVFRRLCTAMQTPQLAQDPRFAGHRERGENAAQLDQLIQQWCRRSDTEATLQVLAEHGVPAGKIYSAADMLQDEHYLAREMVLRPPGPDGPRGPMTGVVPKFSATPGSVRSVGPQLGEHTRQIVTDLIGLDETQLTDLVQRAVLGLPR